jgi:hypothetical protein
MPIPLSTLIVLGTYASIPAYGLAGRIFFASDTGIAYYDTGTAWEEINLAGSAGFTLDSIAGAVELVAGANITIQDNTPSDGKITISAAVSSGGYLKGTVDIPAQSGGGTFTASGTVAGAAVGNDVHVGVNNGTQGSLFTNISGWVSAANTVTVQVTTDAAFVAQYLPVTVFP